MKIPNDIRFHKSHEWVRIEGNMAYIGLSHILAMQLGTIIFIGLPPLGIKVSSDEEIIGSIDALKSAYDIISPLSGIVKMIEEKFYQTPNFAKNSVYEHFLFAIQPTNLAQFEALMKPPEYEKYCKETFRHHENMARCIIG